MTPIKKCVLPYKVCCLTYILFDCMPPQYVPSIEEINNFIPKPTEGERNLLNALYQVLDEKWTVYFQPFLNGLRPDIIIFSEDAGIGIFEVKDWDPNLHRVKIKDDGSYIWQVRQSGSGDWVKKTDQCPLQQVNKYRDCIFKYEIPILQSKTILDKYVYSLIVPLVYFHCHQNQEINEKLSPMLSQKKYSYITVFGQDDLDDNRLQRILDKRHLKHGSKFTNLMKEIELTDRLANALAYPRHGDTNIHHLLKSMSPKQKSLLINPPSKTKRVKGVAGGGKTLVLIHKAVNAAKERKNVLLVCFNITMVNYLRDQVTRLARYYDRNCLQYIEVAHFHRIFPQENSTPDKRNIQAVIDVLLIDEGQDFKREWLQILLSKCAENAHIMFCEDRRQNIYKTEPIPILGRPTELNESYRISPQTAKLANFLSEWTNQEEKRTAVASVQQDLLSRNIWFNGNIGKALNTLKKDVQTLIKNRNIARPDIAILVCTVRDGWMVSNVLDQLSLPYQRNFESWVEYQQLKQKIDKKCANHSPEERHEELERQRKNLRRGYKTGFWMQGGRIKVCTIHSFKGWELSNILVLFNPAEPQKGIKTTTSSEGERNEDSIALLYTAITRSQENLTVYNTYELLVEFGKKAIKKGYAEEHSGAKNSVKFVSQ